jgi:methylated-DNA-protein-cysteine methyltransferase-like protein
MGDFHIDMSRYGWFPENLPSEEGLTEDESDKEGEEEKEGGQ